jgi:iron(III) transport system substrate-binding protein
MKKTFVSAAAFGAALFGYAAAGLAAAPQTVAEIANYEGADRQAILEAGAKKEGTVLIYTTGTQTQSVMDAFRAKYPFLRVEVFRADSAEAARRIVEEYRAARYVVDVISLTTGAQRAVMESRGLQPYKSPEIAAYKKDALEPKGHWVLDYESYLSLGYNTKAVSDAEAPTSLDDLLNPKWAGKMAVPGTTTLGNWVGAMVLDKGEDFVRKLGSQKFRVYEVSGRAVANLVVSGEVPLSPAIYNSHMFLSKKEGASVGWRAIGGTYSTIDAVSLPAKAPHPHAAMLYIDYALSVAGQKALMEIGYATARLDIPNADKPAKIHYLTERPTYFDDIEKWNRLGREVFGRGEKPPENK